MEDKTILGGCLDLGIAKPADYTLIAKKIIEENGNNLKFVVLMEGREPEFFLEYNKYNPEGFVKLNRQGPINYYPNQSDLKSFVKAFREIGIKVFYSFWIHDSRWVFERHPELLLTDCNGKQWHMNNFEFDFNPLLELKEDSVYGIKKGQKFVEYVISQYSKLHSDFGFDGLFIGDGGMGFRVFGDDSKDLRYFDYSKRNIEQFLTWSSNNNSSNNNINHYHKDCQLLNNIETQSTVVLSKDIHFNHFYDWIRWNCFQWAEFYKTLANYLHGIKNELAAFNCMNYGPKEAIFHGVDYKSISQAGLDYLVFQTYDYAGAKYFKIENKDIFTNLINLVNTKLLISKSCSNTKVLFTIETIDNVEKWDCPLRITLREAYTYYSEKIFDGKIWMSSADGAFIVWINNTPYEEFGKIKSILEFALFE